MPPLPPRVRPHDPHAARELTRALRVAPLLGRVLAARGLVDPNAARGFLHPQLRDLTRPDAMADRAAAGERLARALRTGEKIAVFGDYDVDGTTSAALLTVALRSFGGDVEPLLASRFDGGYGLSDAAATRVEQTSATLLVTCDCGTSDHPRLERLRKRGVDAIVVDHHKVPDEALPAVAFLNPHRSDCGFPYKGLASVGLALSLAAEVRARVGAAFDLRPLLDLVAVGTIADVAPLTEDNRILTRAGLERLAQGNGRAGLRALAREAKLKGRPRANDVGFWIAPMMNAPGRLASPLPSLQLMLAESEDEAARLARVLADANEQRRKISAELVTQATAQVEHVYGRELPAGIVVAGAGWHPGVGGIVAGRLVERFGVPVVMVALDGARGVGSVRAPKGFALYDAVSSCAHELERFGGHDAAAGLEVRADRVEALRACFADACRAQSVARATAAQRGDAVVAVDDAFAVDAMLSESDLTTPLVPGLEVLEPTGQSHPEPLVCTQDARVWDVREVGTGHLRVRVKLGRCTMSAFARDGVARRARGELQVPREGSGAMVLGKLRPDPFNGPEAVQLDLVAIGPA